MNKKGVVPDAWDDDWVSKADVSVGMWDSQNKSNQVTATFSNFTATSDWGKDFESGTAS